MASNKQIIDEERAYRAKRRTRWKELVMAICARDYIAAGIWRAHIKDLTNHEIEFINWLMDKMDRRGYA